MSESGGGAKATIAAAVIGAVGIVLAALIAGYMQRPRMQAPEQAVRQPPVATPQAEAPRVQITAARVGKVDPSGQVQGHTTRFAPSDEVAITLRVKADPSVARFPVRVNASLFGLPHTYRADDSADVSVPGSQLLTFRFPSSEHRFGPLFLTVEIEGQKAYSQEISIENE